MREARRLRNGLARDAPATFPFKLFTHRKARNMIEGQAFSQNLPLSFILRRGSSLNNTILLVILSEVCFPNSV